MKNQVIKPSKQPTEEKNLILPIVYLILGFILTFLSNEATRLSISIIGILVIVYGIKTLIEYYRLKDLARFKGVNISIGIASILIGILLIILANEIVLGLRYILGFFLIFIGISRLLTQISYNNYLNITLLSNIVLILMGIYSIFVSNALFVIIGIILILNSCLLFYDYFKK